MGFFKNIILMLLFSASVVLGAAETVVSPALTGRELDRQFEINGAKFSGVYCANYSDEVFSFYFSKEGSRYVLVYANALPATVYSVSISDNMTFSIDREALIFKIKGYSKGKLKLPFSGKLLFVNPAIVPASEMVQGQVVAVMEKPWMKHDAMVEAIKGAGENSESKLPTFKESFVKLWQSTGIYDLVNQSSQNFSETWQLGIGRVLMALISIVLIYLAIVKQYEPLLLLPIGFGALLANIPLAGISGPDGLQGMVYSVGIETGIFPLLIFMGVGAMTDFGPLLANPKTALLGGAAQFGIFAALFGALALGGLFSFELKDAASIGIIGGADGPTAIFLTSKLSPKLLGAIAVAAYSYMALVPIIQPPIMRLLTSDTERKIRMSQLRSVSKIEKICFPILITVLCALLLPDAAPLIGMLMFGNLMKESGVVNRLSDTAQNALINIVTIFLGIAVGSKLEASAFLSIQTIGILLLGIVAFCIGTSTGVIFAKVMNVFCKDKINPLIGSAGVSAVPMAARVSNRVGLEADPQNFLLMHAMGPNVAGVIGSAVAAGILLQQLKNII